MKQTDREEMTVRLCRLYRERHGDDGAELVPSHLFDEGKQRPVVFDVLVTQIDRSTYLMDIHEIFELEIAPFTTLALSKGYDGMFVYDGLEGRIQLDFSDADSALRFKLSL